MTEKSLSMKDIAARIGAHLKRMELDPEVNVVSRVTGLHRFYHAGCFSTGKKIHVRYIAFQASRPLSRENALEYLAWLDAGNVGRNDDMKLASERSE